jgi:hypothetical protein
VFKFDAPSPFVIESPTHAIIGFNEFPCRNRENNTKIKVDDVALKKGREANILLFRARIITFAPSPAQLRKTSYTQFTTILGELLDNNHQQVVKL